MSEPAGLHRGRSFSKSPGSADSHDPLPPLTRSHSSSRAETTDRLSRSTTSSKTLTTQTSFSTKAKSRRKRAKAPNNPYGTNLKKVLPHPIAVQKAIEKEKQETSVLSKERELNYMLYKDDDFRVSKKTAAQLTQVHPPNFQAPKPRKSDPPSAIPKLHSFPQKSVFSLHEPVWDISPGKLLYFKAPGGTEPKKSEDIYTSVEDLFLEDQPIELNIEIVDKDSPKSKTEFVGCLHRAPYDVVCITASMASPFDIRNYGVHVIRFSISDEWIDLHLNVMPDSNIRTPKSLRMLDTFGAPVSQCEISVKNEEELVLHHRLKQESTFRLPPFLPDGAYTIYITPSSSKLRPAAFRVLSFSSSEGGTSGAREVCPVFLGREPERCSSLKEGRAEVVLRWSCAECPELRLHIWTSNGFSASSGSPKTSTEDGLAEIDCWDQTLGLVTARVKLTERSKLLLAVSCPKGGLSQSDAILQLYVDGSQRRIPPGTEFFSKSTNLLWLVCMVDGVERLRTFFDAIEEKLPGDLDPLPVFDGRFAPRAYDTDFVLESETETE